MPTAYMFIHYASSTPCCCVVPWSCARRVSRSSLVLFFWTCIDFFAKYEERAKAKGMCEQIASCDEFRNTISSGSEYSLGHCIRSFPVLISLLFSFPSCLSHSLLFLLSCPSCPNTSLLFHSISSWILFHSFFAVPGIVLIVVVKIKSRV